MTSSAVVFACGALVNELTALRDASSFDLDLQCLPVGLHHRPGEIGPALRRKLEQRGPDAGPVLIGYADCGTNGEIDELCTEFGATRLPGAHCFEFFAGKRLYDALQDAEPGTFYLSDYLARHFELFVMDGLGITTHPQLQAMYFGNYRRLVHLDQASDPDIQARAAMAAERLGLTFERRVVGLGELEGVVVAFANEARVGRKIDQHLLAVAAGRA